MPLRSTPLADSTATRTPIFYGWWMVLAYALILAFVSTTLGFGSGLLVDPIRSEFGWPQVAVAAAFSLRTEAGAIASPFAGALIDRFGCRWTLAAGLLFIATGLFFLSTVDSLWTFYAAFVVLAIGQSTIGGQAASVSVARWFVRKRNRALAIVWMGPGVAIVTLPLFGWLISTLGWRTALLAWIAVVAFCLPLAFVVREYPEKYGLLPDGDPIEPGSQHLESGGIARQAARARGVSMTTRQALTNRTFWKLGLVLALTNFAAAPVTQLVVPALTHEGVDPGTATLVAGLLPSVYASSRLGLAKWGDRADKRDLIAFCFGAQAVGILLLAGVSPSTLLFLVPFIALFGVGFGIPVPLRSSVIADYFGVQSMGKIQGFIQFLSTIGGVLGPIAQGLMVDRLGSFRWTFVLFGACSAVAVPLMLTLPRTSAAPRHALPEAPAPVTR